MTSLIHHKGKCCRAGSFDRGPVQIKKTVGVRKSASEKEQAEDKATVPKQVSSLDMHNIEGVTFCCCNTVDVYSIEVHGILSSQIKVVVLKYMGFCHHHFVTQ